MCDAPTHFACVWLVDFFLFFVFVCVSPCLARTLVFSGFCFSFVQRGPLCSLFDFHCFVCMCVRVCEASLSSGKHFDLILGEHTHLFCAHPLPVGARTNACCCCWCCCFSVHVYGRNVRVVHVFIYFLLYILACPLIERAFEFSACR